MNPVEANVPRFEPMTTGSLLDQTFRLYGGNFALIVGIVALSHVPIYVLHVLILWPQLAGVPEGAMVWMALGNALVSLLWALVAYPLAQGAATYAISERYLGNPVTILEGYRKAWSRFGTLLNTQISVGLRVLLGFLLLIIPGIIFMLAYAVAIPIVMVEGHKTRESMRRSWELSKGNRRKVFGVIFLLVILSWAWAAGSVLVSNLAFGESRIGALVEVALQDGGNLLVTPLGVIAAILLYYDFRIRKEGFDLERLGQELEGIAPQASRPPMITPEHGGG